MEKDSVAGTAKKRGLLNAIFCFLDESAFSEKPPIRKTWGKRGKTPIIKTTGSWKTLSVTGIITVRARGKKPRAYFTVKKGAVRSDDSIRTLKHLMRSVSGLLALFWDGLPAHRSKAVKTFLHLHRHRFRIVERFPAYAPELNPQEYLWSASKGRDMANFCPSKDTDLYGRTRKSLKRIQRSERVMQGALRKSGLFI